MSFVTLLSSPCLPARSQAATCRSRFVGSCGRSIVSGPLRSPLRADRPGDGVRARSGHCLADSGVHLGVARPVTAAATPLRRRGVVPDVLATSPLDPPHSYPAGAHERGGKTGAAKMSSSATDGSTEDFESRRASQVPPGCDLAHAQFGQAHGIGELVISGLVGTTNAAQMRRHLLNAGRLCRTTYGLIIDLRRAVVTLDGDDIALTFNGVEMCGFLSRYPIAIVALREQYSLFLPWAWEMQYAGQVRSAFTGIDDAREWILSVAGTRGSPTASSRR